MEKQWHHHWDKVKVPDGRLLERHQVQIVDGHVVYLISLRPPERRSVAVGKCRFY